MDWTQVQTVVRLWSLRPWLYNWEIASLELPDKKVDDRWLRWFHEVDMVKKNKKPGDMEELDDGEIDTIKKVYQIYTLLFGNQEDLKVKDLDEIKMLVYRTSTIGNWLNKLVLEAREMPAVRAWTEQLPLPEETDILLLVFVCYNYCILLKIVDRLDRGVTLRSLMFSESDEIKLKREEGNTAFKDGMYKVAVSFYTDALKQMTYNQKLYGNRAQAHLKMNNPRAAACDGMRCVYINPMWDKGWVRYSSGLLAMGRAVEAWQVIQAGIHMIPEPGELLTNHANDLKKNEEVAKYLMSEQVKKHPLLKMDPDGMTHKTSQTVGNIDSSSQTSSIDDMPELVSDGEDTITATKAKKSSSSRKTSSVPKNNSAAPKKEKSSAKKASDAKVPVMKNGTVKADIEKPRKSEKAVPVINNPMPVNINNNNMKKTNINIMQSKPTSHLSVEGSRARNLLASASAAWLEKRMRNSVTSYSEALGMLTPTIQKEIGYNDDQVAVVMYVLGLSYISIGTEKDVQDGLEHFSNILERFRHLVFPLAYLGIGMTYTKWNRFKMAIEPLSKGLRITKKHPLTQVYAWPETNVCIEESNKERLTTCLESMLIECHQPPKPHAICRYYDCNHYKIEIYLSDPDFKGYVELRCYAHCTITYHQDCWKKYKSASDKEILSGKCFTPNCVAPLSRILMYDHTGEVAIEKENKLPPKDPVQPKPSKKLKPSSQNTINKRIERKQRRKQKREEERQKKEEACKLDELLDTVESAPNNVELEQKAAPEVDLLTCTTINPKREEEEQRDQEAKKLKKKRRVQKEQRVVVRLDVMTPEMPPCVGAVSYDDEGQSLPTAGTFGGLDDFEEITGFPSLNPVTPFAVPSHLVADVSYFEDPMAESASSPTHHSIPSIPSRSASPAVSETAEREKEIFEANHRQAIRESLFQLFKGILQDSGPLHIDDSRITLELANFPSDTLNIIEAEGGIGGFLKKSINFTLIDDIVGLIKDSNKIRKVANKRKAQLRKSATNNRSKKGALDAIPSHLKPTTVTAAQPSTSSVPDNNFTFTVPAPVAKFAGDHESDRDSIISSDTACSEPCDIISNSSRNSSGRNKPLSFTSSSGGGVSGKSSPWQRHPSLSLENLQYTEAEPQSLDKAAYPPSPEEVPKVQMSNVEVLNAYRLGANHLRTAVDLGRLAKRVNVHLGVEVRLLYGWEHTTGLEELDTATVTEATTILQDALEVVTSSASVVYSTGNSTFGAEVYFFGLGQNSIDGEHGKWVPGPEVGFNNFIVIALLLDHVDIEQMTVEISQLDQASVETLRALNNAANTVRGIGDHFKGSIDIKTAILPVFSTMGRRVAVDDPETLALLAQSTQTHKSPPELAFNTASSIQSLSPLPSSPPALQSPIPQSPIARPLRPTSSGYSSPSHIQPLLSLNHLQNTMNPSQPAPPFSFSNPIASPPVSMSVPPLMSIPNQLFKPSFDGSSFRPSIWDSGHDETATGLLSDAYNYKGPQTAAEQNRKRQEDDLKAAVMQVNEYAVATEQLKERIAILEERLIATTNERDQCHVQQSTLLSLQQALHEKAQELSTCQVAAQQMQTNLTAKNQELVAQIENICRSTEVEMAKAEVQIDDYRSKAQREMSLRMATETQYQDVVRERDRALNEICTKHQDEKKRAENAEIAMLQLKLEVGLQIIDRSAKEAELFISKIQAGAKQYTDQFMAVPMEYKTAEEAWKTTLSRIKLTREMAVTSFEDQKTQVKNGIRLETLPTLDLPRPPPAPEMPQLRPAPSLIQPVMGNGDIGKMLPYDHLSHAATNGTASGPMSSSSSTTAYLSRPSQPLTAAAAVTPSVHSLKPQQPMTVATAVASQMSALHTAAKSRPPGFSAAAAAAPAPTSVRVTKSKNSFDRIVDQIQMKFPCFDRSKISAFLQQLRESRGGSLSGMKMENVLSNVERYIQRQYQPSLGATAGSGSSGSSMAALDPMTLETFMEEDPCTICLDELLPGSTQELDCRHRFHAACIRQWLREKSTCPNCNTHALLPDEFPVLGS